MWHQNIGVNLWFLVNILAESNPIYIDYSKSDLQCEILFPISFSGTSRSTRLLLGYIAPSLWLQD